jgi:peptidoglycan/LPS O-acetylase OafA/YrhL
LAVKPAYRPELDGLRAVAALTVCGYHARVPALQGGFIGVDLFFVLSGFLITSLLRGEMERGEIDLRAFFRRRFMRLYPALAFMLAGFLALGSLWPGHQWEAALAALYVTNVTAAVADYPQFLRHTWSLATEAQFYLLWPLVLPLLKRPALFLTALYFLATVVRLGMGYEAGYPMHFSGLVLGALLTYAPRAPGWLAWPALAALGALTVLLSDTRPQELLLWITAAEVASAALIASVAQSPSARTALSSRPLVGVGIVSYAVYLWDYPFTRLLSAAHTWQVTLAMTLPLALCMAGVSWLLVEQPRSPFRLALAWRASRSARRGSNAIQPPSCPTPASGPGG